MLKPCAFLFMEAIPFSGKQSMVLEIVPIYKIEDQSFDSAP